MERRIKPAVYVPLEDLITKFKSKSDRIRLSASTVSAIRLYTIVAYFLPPFDKCPVSFLRSLLSGEKKVNKHNYHR